MIRWTDAYPGRLTPADGPVLKFERETSNGWEITIWDDDRDLEVRAIRAQGQRGYLWEARWTPQTRAGRHRLVLVARAGFPEVAGQPFELCR